MSGMETVTAAQKGPQTAHRHLMAWAYHVQKGIHEEVSLEAISDALEHDSLLWLDITAPQAEDLRLLEEEFHLHPLALEEMLTPHPRPKCMEFAKAYVLVMFAVDAAANLELHFREVVIYMGTNFLVTTHNEPFPEIEECVRRWRANAMPHKEAIAAPLYSLLDTLVDGYFPVIDQITEMVESVEDHIFAGDRPVQGQEIFRLKKDLLALRRVVSGQRDALNLILRQDLPIIPEASLLYFQSVYDHLVRLVESVDTYRDLLSSAMDLHLSVLSNRMNQVMKTLTVISTILMSASLIAGIYGMNFENMPELHTRYGYYGALGGMAAIAGLLVVYFKRKNWF